MGLKKKVIPRGQQALVFTVESVVPREPQAQSNVISFKRAKREPQRAPLEPAEKLLLDRASKLRW